MACYKGSLRGALAATFPVLTPHLSRRTFFLFSSKSYYLTCCKGNKANVGYWHNIDNRRKYFQQFAALKGFDPSDAAKWSQVKRSQLVVAMVRVLANFTTITPYRNRDEDLFLCSRILSASL